jgi:hypothetical protein
MEMHPNGLTAQRQVSPAPVDLDNSATVVTARGGDQKSKDKNRSSCGRRCISVGIGFVGR